jgi:hypothetical protein
MGGCNSTPPARVPSLGMTNSFASSAAVGLAFSVKTSFGKTMAGSNEGVFFSDKSTDAVMSLLGLEVHFSDGAIHALRTLVTRSTSHKVYSHGHGMLLSVSVCVSQCYVYFCVCLCMHVSVYVFLCLSVYVCVCVFLFLSVSVRVYLCLSVSVWVCMCMYMCLSVSICIFMCLS